MQSGHILADGDIWQVKTAGVIIKQQLRNNANPPPPPPR